jgi:hypothetical protein
MSSRRHGASAQPKTRRNLVSNFKKGQKVKATTVRGAPREGTFVATHSTTKGDWVEIQPATGKAFKTRPSMVTAA